MKIAPNFSLSVVFFNRFFGISVFIFVNETFCLQCYDAVGWAAGRASGL